MNDWGEIKVTKQVKVSLAINKCKDEVICDGVLMHAGHLILGRSWQYNRKVVHDGFINRFFICHKRKPITFLPLNLKQVHKEQMHLKQKNEEIRKEELKREAKEARGKAKQRERENEKDKEKLSEKKEERKVSFYARRVM